MGYPLPDCPGNHAGFMDFETIVRDHPDSILVIDNQGELIFSNKVGKKLLNRLLGQDSQIPTVLRRRQKPCMTHTLPDRDGHELVLKIEARPIQHLGKPARLFAISDITHQSQHYRNLEKLVYIDHLTELYNRRGLELVAEDLCEAASIHNGTISAFFVDINGLKQINDTLGHQTGDEAIRETAELLNNSFRDNAIKARIGGDEFVVLLQEDPDAPTEVSLALLRRNLIGRNTRNNTSFQLSISIGVVCYPADQDFDFHCLLEEADRRMYRAKQQTAFKTIAGQKGGNQIAGYPDNSNHASKSKTGFVRLRHRQDNQA